MTDESLKLMCNALMTNTHLKALDLANNQFTAQGAMFLAEVLRVNSTLVQLNLSNNNLTEMGGKALAQALKQNHTMTYLNVEVMLMFAWFGKERAPGTAVKGRSEMQRRMQKNVSQDSNSETLASLCSEGEHAHPRSMQQTPVNRLGKQSGSRRGRFWKAALGCKDWLGTVRAVRNNWQNA